MAKANPFTSIILVHYAMTEKRSEIMMTSIASLFENTNSPFELIVVDNGGSKADSEFFFDLVEKKEINFYIKNAENMHFGFARNQGLAIAQGDYLCIVDNDILYRKGWLEKCINVLEAHPDKKIYATPVYNVAHWLPKFWSGELKVGKEVYRLNSRAGSNCWVMRRKDFEGLGGFLAHRVAGTKWTEKAIENGYMAAVTPTLLVEDLCFREGYNFKQEVPIKETLSDGTEIYYNDDEFKKKHHRLHYFQQRGFNPKDNLGD